MNSEKRAKRSVRSFIRLAVICAAAIVFFLSARQVTAAILVEIEPDGDVVRRVDLPTDDISGDIGIQMRDDGMIVWADTRMYALNNDWEEVGSLDTYDWYITREQIDPFDYDNRLVVRQLDGNRAVSIDDHAGVRWKTPVDELLRLEFVMPAPDARLVAFGWLNDEEPFGVGIVGMNNDGDILWQVEDDWLNNTVNSLFNVVRTEDGFYYGSVVLDWHEGTGGLFSVNADGDFSLVRQDGPRLDDLIAVEESGALVGATFYPDSQPPDVDDDSDDDDTDDDDSDDDDTDDEALKPLVLWKFDLDGNTIWKTTIDIEVAPQGTSLWGLHERADGNLIAFLTDGSVPRASAYPARILWVEFSADGEFVAEDDLQRLRAINASVRDVRNLPDGNVAVLSSASLVSDGVGVRICVYQDVYTRVWCHDIENENRWSDAVLDETPDGNIVVGIGDRIVTTPDDDDDDSGCGC